MRFEVLGPLRAVAPVPAGGDPLLSREQALGGPKQRLVLALLLAEPNSTVSVERLIDGVWGEAPPDTARHTLQSYVSELRKSVGEIIERDGTGYSIRIDQEGLDALQFEARISEARARLDSAPEAALDELDAAMALWRGRPFEDFPDQPALQADAIRLDELRMAAIEAALGKRLALGQHAAVAVELERLTREYPYREELRALHMLALYRSGRQADALRAFQATRAVLGEELGIDPSPRLRRLEEQILLQDPDLDPAQPASAPTGRTDARLENPFMGLRAFREADATRFFGQDRLVEQLSERVTGGAHSFTAVVGPSGSGKSSAVQAGLLPRLRRDVPHLRIAVMQPGAQPFAELEAALARLPGGDQRVSLSQLRATESGILNAADRVIEPISGRLLLVVDQFEELFTLADPDEAEEFLAAIVLAAQESPDRVHVLVTMRADFYDRPLASPRLGSLFAANVVNVVPLTPEDLEAAATQPARQLDVTVEPRLVGRLIADVAGQPNALPLFQYALTELFDERTGPVLDLATYERVGGVRRAVARRAESLYTKLDGPEQEAVRQLFLRIATVSGAAVGRRRVPASELAELDVDIVALQAAIDAFARYRLLALDRDPTTGAPSVEVAHEALLAEWHRLRDWIDESREDLATHARFAIAVNEWEASGRDAGYLLTGSRLGDYEAWAASTRLKLTDTEHAFIDDAVATRDAESTHDREREAEAAKLRRRSRRQLATLFVAITLLAGLVAYPLLTAEDAPGQVAVALEFARDEAAFDEIIARGVENAAEEHGLDAVILEPPYSDVTHTYQELAEDGGLVIGTRVMWEDMVNAAQTDSDATFVFLDYADAPDIPNGVAVSFAQEEGSFLVGAAAALESETGRVGYIGANISPDLIEEFRAGFEQGAKAARPDVEIVSAVIDPDDTSGVFGYEDERRARELAEWMYLDEDVDVIFTAAGGSGRAVIEAATELSADAGRHLWAIGVDSDSVFDLPAEQRDYLLTSMVKRLDIGVELVVAAHEDGTLAVPSRVRLGVADDAVGYSTSGGNLRASTISELEALEAAIKQGSIVVEPTPTGKLREPPPAPVAADTPETRAAVDVANRYFAALQADDVDAAVDTLANFSTIELYGQRNKKWYESVLTMDKAQGATYRDVDCIGRLPPSGLVIECSFTFVDGLDRLVGSPPTQVLATITVANGAILRLHLDALSNEVVGVDDAFVAWLEATHPDVDADTVLCCPELLTVEKARALGEQRVKYGTEWAAFLEAEGCSWDDGCTRS